MIPVVLKNRINASLFISALYFMLWSVAVISFPALLSTVVIDKASTPIIFWDFMGLITFVLGVGMMIAAFNPYRHWNLILIVTLFHLFMIGGFLWGFTHGFFNIHFLPFLFFNHLIWLIPNGYALYLVYQRSFSADEMLLDSFNNVQFPLALFDTTTGENIGEVSEKSSVMLVFLRHFGCPFCKDSLLALQEYRHELEAKGISIVLVYMSDEITASTYLTKYNLNDLLQVSDPEEIFYKSFKLRRGRFFQLFGLKVWRRWIELAWKKKLFNTKPEGDVAQMPGIFLLEDGKVVQQFLYESIADQPDYRVFLDYIA